MENFKPEIKPMVENIQGNLQGKGNKQLNRATICANINENQKVKKVLKLFSE